MLIVYRYFEQSSKRSRMLSFRHTHSHDTFSFGYGTFSPCFLTKCNMKYLTLNHVLACESHFPLRQASETVTIRSGYRNRFRLSLRRKIRSIDRRAEQTSNLYLSHFVNWSHLFFRYSSGDKFAVFLDYFGVASVLAPRSVTWKDGRSQYFNSDGGCFFSYKSWWSSSIIGFRI